MDEFDPATKEHMVETIEDCLSSGNTKDGGKLSKDAFQMMYSLAMGVNPAIVANNYSV